MRIDTTTAFGRLALERIEDSDPSDCAFTFNAATTTERMNEQAKSRRAKRREDVLANYRKQMKALGLQPSA